MLSVMRKYRSSVLGLIVIGICAVMMLGFSVDMFGPANSNQIAATVNGDVEISTREYFLRQQQIAQAARQQYGENFEAIKAMLNVEQQAIDSLISERLLNAFVSDLGLTTSVPKIEQQIKSHPYFASGFTREAYQRYLSAMGMNSAKLESTLRDELTRQQLGDIFTDLGRPSERELKLAFDNENTKAKFRYAEISTLPFEAEVNTSDQVKLEEYFKKNSEDYRVPTKIRYSYVTFKPAEHEANVSIAEEDLEAAYRERRAEFDEPRKVRVSQIFFDISKEKQTSDAADTLLKGKDSKEKKAADELKPKDVKLLAAQDAQRRLDNGEAFADIAKDVSDDEETKAAGGAIDWKSVEDFEPAIRKGLADVEAGQVSDVIETEEGFYLIKVEEAQEARQKPLEEIKPLLEAELKKEDAPLFTSLAAENFLGELQSSGSSFSDYAKQKNLTVLNSNGLLDGSKDPEGSEPGLTARALRIGEGQTQIVEITTGDALNAAYVVNIEEVKDSHIPEFAAVKEEVISDYKKAEAVTLAKAFADKIADDLKAEQKPTLDGLDKNEKYLGKVKLDTTPLITRNDAWGGESVGPDLRAAAFALSPDRPVAPKAFSARDSFYLVELLEKQAPAGEDLKKKQDEFKQAQAMRDANRMLYTLVEVLRADAKVEVNNEALQLGGNANF